MRELAGKADFVTGGASGIGLTMATAFARDVDAWSPTSADPSGVDRAAHPGMRAEVEERFSAILAAMDAVSA